VGCLNICLFLSVSLTIMFCFRKQQKEDMKASTRGKKRVPDEVSMYLSRAALLIRKGEVDLANEPFLLDNVYKEMDGLEKEISCEKSTSKWLETIVKNSNQAHLRGFLHRLALGVGTEDAAFAELCTDPYCSFVLQSVFQRLGEAAPAPEGGPIRDSHGVKMPEIGDQLLAWLKRMGEDLIGMAHQRQASFVLRALILLFGNCHETRKNETVSVRDGEPLSWMALGFGKLFDLLLAGLNRSAEEVREAARSPSAAAALGTFLAVCDENARTGGRVLFAERRDKLVCALTFLPGPSSKQVVIEETSLFVELACDATGSQLMQRIVQRCHSTHFRTIWTCLLLPQARKLAVDPSANYVMTAAVERANTEGGAEIVPMLEGLCKPNLVALFNAQVYKLILAMLKAASVLSGAPGVLWRKRLVAQLGQSEVAAPLLPQLCGSISASASGTVAGGGVGMSRTDLACAVHGMGEEGPAVVDAFWDGLTEEQVRAACCSRVWSMVIESFLKGNSGRNCKHKLVRKMASSFVEIARDKYGFHAALTALNVAAADGQASETHAQLSRVLKQNREYVTRSEWGQKLVKKLAQQRAQEDAAVPEEAAVPLTVEALLRADEPPSKKSKKKAKKRSKKREREEQEEAKQE
jgi:hypothetical protein